MAKGKMGLSTFLVMVVAVVSLVGGAAAASFPVDCDSSVLDGGPRPSRFCCIAVQDQFLLKKSEGIPGYCKAVTGVKRFDGLLVGTLLISALSIPDKCNLDSYYKKGFLCAGKLIPGGV